MIFTVNFSHLHYNVIQWMRVDIGQKGQNSPKLFIPYITQMRKVNLEEGNRYN